jgi:CBS domain-containing protein
MRVEEILRSKNAGLVTVSPDISVRRAAAMITDQHVGMLLVVDTRQGFIGMLSERDVVRCITTRGENALASPVRAAMSSARVVATPEDSVAAVMREMTDRRARHVPVLSEGKLVGVVSIGDILKSRIAEKDQEAAVLRDLARLSLVGAA